MKLFSRAKGLFDGGKKDDPFNQKAADLLVGRNKDLFDRNLLDSGRNKLPLVLLDAEIMEDLIDHVRNEDVDYIRKVDQKVLLKARDAERNTALLIATKKGNLSLCKEIMKKCPSLLYDVNNRNQTILHQATDSSLISISREIFLFIDFFVSVGVDELKTSNNEGHIYMNFKRWLKMQDSKGDTALVIAARLGYLHIVKRFVEVDRQYNLGLSKVIGGEGKAALVVAVEKEDLEMVKLLTDEGDPYSDFVPYSTAIDLFLRVKRGDLNYINTVELNSLLNSRDKDRSSALCIATQYNQYNQFDCSKELLKRCPSFLYHQNNYKWSVLHHAAYHKNYRLIDFYVSAGLEAAKSEGGTDNMIRFKKWINLQNRGRNTALILAVGGGSHDIVKRFVEVDHQYMLGLSEIVGSNKRTALQWAMHYKDNKIIKMLTSSRDPNLSGAGGESERNIFTLAEVSKHNNLKDCWLLINYKVYDVTKFVWHHPGGSDVLLKASGKVATTEFKKVHSHSDNAMIMMDKFYIGVCDSTDLVRRGDLDYIKTVDPNILLNARDHNGSTVLMIATQKCHLNSCKEILKKCPSLLYHQDKYESSVLHHAAYSRNYRLIDFFLSAGLKAAKIEGGTKSMIHFKKWINLQNSTGNSALIVAVIKRSHDLVKRFVEVDHHYKLGLCKIIGSKKKTALQWATHYEDHEMIKILTSSRDPSLDYGAQESLNIDNDNFPISIPMEEAQESLQTGNCSGSGVVSESNIFTFAEVSKHNNLMDCWLLINNKIYDVTKFLEDHPGGSEALLKASGKDATTDFKKAHSHSSNAVAMMDKFYVGMCDSITCLLSQLANDRPQLYSWVQLKEFTKDFSQPLGSGGFGDVYKGRFPEGMLIAVKVLKNIEFKEKVMEDQFKAEVDTMGKAYHQNLIKLHGYCYEANTKYKALVYDYMENGSFDKILFEKKLDIPWMKLHNIAKEIAQGVSYLHEGCNPRIIHYDIKPANVLLDSNLSPKVIDFGLAEITNMGESQFEQTEIKGSRGYMAPEVNQLTRVKLSYKLDVYSYGMMLFDILGSKRNYVDKRWFPGQVWDMYRAGKLEKFILDCGINEEDKKNAERFAIIALLCVEHDPQTRPMLSSVVKMLEGKIKLDTPVTPFYPGYCSSENSSMSDSRDC